MSRNVIFLISRNVLTSILSFALAVILARKWGALTFGEYSFIFAFTGMFSFFTDFGLNTLTIRDVAKNKELANKYLINSLVIKFFLVILAFTSICVIANFLPKSKPIILGIYLVGLIMFFEIVIGSLCAIFVAYEKIINYAILDILRALTILTFGALLAYLNLKIVPVILVHFFTAIFIMLLYYIVFSKKLFVPHLEINLGFAKKLLTQAFPLAILGILNLIFWRISMTMLSLMKDDTHLGFFTAAYQPVNGLFLITGAFALASFPRISSLYAQSLESLKYFLHRLIRIVFSISFPLAIGGTILADKIILLLYGQNYINSIIVFQILIWRLAITFSRVACGQTLVAANRQNQLLILSLTRLIMIMVLNLFFIPRWGHIGASLSIFIGDFIFVILLLYIFPKYLFILDYQKMLSRPFLAAILMGIYVYLLRDLNIFFTISTSILLYFSLLFILGGLSPEDKDLIKKLLENFFSKIKIRT